MNPGDSTPRHDVGAHSRPPAIVLGLSGSAMGVIRSLSRLGVDVYGVYSDPAAEVARHSRLLKGRYRISRLDRDTEILRVIRSIGRLAGNDPKVVLIPTNDVYARFVSAHRAELQDRCLLRVPPPAIGDTFLDKRATAGICRTYGMPVPESFVPNGLYDVEQWTKRCRYPVIIKPTHQYDADFPGKNVVAGDAAELLAFYRRKPELIDRSMFQELIPSGDGHLITVNSYSNTDGQVLAQVSLRKLRQWLPDIGTACFSVSETHPHLLDLTRAFLEDIGFIGFSSIEFAEDTRSGVHRFLELNGRVVYRNQQHADSGVDLVALGYLEMCGSELPEVPPQRDGIYWVDIHRDIPSFMLKRLRGELAFATWIRSLRLATSFAIYDRQDLKPFVASILHLSMACLGRSSGRQTQPWRRLKALRRWESRMALPEAGSIAEHRSGLSSLPLPVDTA